MKLADIYADGRFGLSFELFPPKTEAGEAALFSHVEKLVELSPSFITCTYGAGGSTQTKTLDIIAEVKRRFGLPIASHLTCVGSTRDQLRAYLAQAKDQAVDYIVALRGDPPKGETEFKPIENGLSYANELVSLIRSEFNDFGIAVAGYPEKHQEAPSMDIDLANLKRKVDCGADSVVTQLFYCNDDFYRFRDRCEAAGISVPIVPGLLPVTSLAQIKRITSMCAASLPADFVDELGKKDDADWQKKVGIEYATRQVQALLDKGVAGLHFYVLNKSEATLHVAQQVNPPLQKIVN
jgi:methylenetetrahydrofolate reductase (NADPH)